MDFKKVLVVYGGWNRERDVSLMSAPAIIEELQKQGFHAQGLDFTTDFAKNISIIEQFQPDVIFNNIYGKVGEDGCLQGLWESMRIPYTHSGVRASAVAMHKPTTQYILKTHNIRIPPYHIIYKNNTTAIPLPFPLVLKPADDGSSVDVKIVKDQKALQLYLQNCPDQEIMAESFIPGHELSVAVFEDGRAGVMEIIPKNEFYDYEAKYLSDDTQYVCPPNLPGAIQKEAIRLSLEAFQILNCKGVARVDLRYNPQQSTQGLYFLEINTVPGLTSHSIVPKIAKTLGMDFGQLLSWIVHKAICPN